MPAVSEKQRKMMAIAEHHPEKLYAENKGALKMSKSQLHDYAATKSPGKKKPDTVKNNAGHDIEAMAKAEKTTGNPSDNPTKRHAPVPAPNNAAPKTPVIAKGPVTPRGPRGPKGQEDPLTARKRRQKDAAMAAVKDLAAGNMPANFTLGKAPRKKNLGNPGNTYGY